MPNLSIAVGSRNACVMCHKDKDNEWALKAIQSWHPDFDKRTAPELERALLVKAMRQGDMQKLSAALAYISDPASDPLFVTTLIRLLPPVAESRQHTILRERLAKAVHPLVRSAAATALDADSNPADRPALFAALSDNYRLVRIRAAERLAALPDGEIPAEHRKAFDTAMKELWTSMNIRLDHWSSPYNAGNILMRQSRYTEAAEKYDRAHKLRDDIAQPLINGSMAFARLGNMKDAETRLLKATQLPEPSAEAHFNLGLLYGEQGRTNDAVKQLTRSLEIQPRNAQAACNLAILLADTDIVETFRLLNRAIELDPYNPRYVETLAYYYMQTRQPGPAKKIIEQAFQRGMDSRDLQIMYQQLR
jgi:Flp pilus assembly protein TadD